MGIALLRNVQGCYYVPTEKGFEEAEVFKYCCENDTGWWAVWFWKGWVRDEFTPEEWAEWEAHCAKQRAAADERALAESAEVAAFFLGQGRPDPLGR